MMCLIRPPQFGTAISANFNLFVNNQLKMNQNLKNRVSTISTVTQATHSENTSLVIY